VRAAKEGEVPAIGRLRYVYLAYFSRPASERGLYRLIRRNKPQRIVEIGIGDGHRAARMIQVAARYRTAGPIRYAGVDLFETRSAEHPGLTLKQAHRLLKPSGARVQLIPGDPLAALARAANALAGTDLVIISADQDASSLTAAWFYVPRMLHEGSCVLVECEAEEGKLELRPLSKSEIHARARGRRRRMAA